MIALAFAAAVLTFALVVPVTTPAPMLIDLPPVTLALVAPVTTPAPMPIELPPVPIDLPPVTLAPTPTPAPASGPTVVTVLCAGTMTQERALDGLAGVPADLWTFTFARAHEGKNWRHGAELIPTQPGQGDLPLPTIDHAICLAVRSDYANPGDNNGASLSGPQSCGVYDTGDLGQFRAIIVHELLHTLDGVDVYHTRAEMAADPRFVAWLAAHPTPGDEMTLSNAYGVDQCRARMTVDYEPYSETNE